MRGEYADDVRSDGEDDSEDINDEHIIETIESLDENTAPAFFEEEVGVEAINLKGNKYRKGAAASGVSLPGDRSDRKDLLGRIGCDKPV